jgi:hypothetical protein
MVLGQGFDALAQDLEPRSYTNLPIGQTFAVVGVARAEGDLTLTSTSPLQDAELTVDGLVVAMAHTFALAGDSAKVDLVGTRYCYQGDGKFNGEAVGVDRCEYSDPAMRLTWNFYGAPATTLEEFGRIKPGLVVGTSLQVNAPVGTYHSEHLINAGANRWVVRPGLGMSYVLGDWFIDASSSVRIFEDNDNFFNGNKLEQDPLYQAEIHLVYNLKKGRWLALDANYFVGGETSKNGVKSDDRQENSRLGLTFSTPITAHHSIKLVASRGVVTRVGNKFDTYGIFWQYRF